MIFAVAEGVAASGGLEDFYSLLGAWPGASQLELRAAWHRELMQWHPDHNPDPSAARRVMMINNAFEVLSDPFRRRQYDRAHGFARPPVANPLPTGSRRVTSREMRALAFFARGLALVTAGYAILWLGFYGFYSLVLGWRP